MKIELEINAPTAEEFGELIFTLLHTAYGVDPDTCKATWDGLSIPDPDGGEESLITRDIYCQVGTTIREMQLAYYKAGVEAGVQATQIGGPIESQN